MVPEESRRVSTGLEMADGGDVAPGAPQPTFIKVHIHQDSALAKLLLSRCSLLQPHVPSPHAASQALGHRRLLVASWVVQIVLGVLSGVLGGFLFIFHSTTLLGSGAPIWSGAVAVLAGAVAFIYEKRSGTYWALLRTLLTLAAFSTATAAIIIGARRFHEYHRAPHRVFFNGICDVSPSWGPTGAPSSPSADKGRLQLCTSYVNMLKALFIGIKVMLLGVWALLLLASLVPLCLCCWRKYRSKEKRDPPLEETAGSE
ncbi:transmembrane protein 176A [Mesoplodon densirostris]|uniref:transmembrane protein 176A n=1 Tax=Mesoplodon densirostris TaxID=48708 RepID=UPI0028DBBE51|nr:transmembrane protein 176A [Mesoplodon densirostris]